MKKINIPVLVSSQRSATGYDVVSIVGCRLSRSRWGSAFEFVLSDGTRRSKVIKDTPHNRKNFKAINLRHKKIGALYDEIHDLEAAYEHVEASDVYSERAKG